MFFKKTTILVGVLLILGAYCYAQKPAERFSLTVLKKPIDNSTWFDTNISIFETPLYSLANDSSTVFLWNGYASHELLNSKEWLQKRENIIPLRVQVVFTKQPFDKNDWKTNYYELLANRIAEVLLIDSTLNSMEVEWELIKQTKASNTSEAKKLPHGIAITYKNSLASEIEVLKAKQFDNNSQNEIEKCLNKPINKQELASEPTEDELEATLYPMSVTERDTEWHKPQKTKKTNEPRCPTFKTRMEKPKRDVFSRIFRR